MLIFFEPETDFEILGLYMKKKGSTILIDSLMIDLDHGLRTPRESFFQKFKTFWLGQTNWAGIL